MSPRRSTAAEARRGRAAEPPRGQRATGALLALLALPAAAWLATRESTLPAAPSANAIAARIDLRTASEAELRLLPGIGPTLSDRIVEHRASGARLVEVEDLDAIRGIGPRTVERLRPWLE